MSWKKLICLLVGHTTNSPTPMKIRVSNSEMSACYRYINVHCARCGTIIDTYFDPNITPVQKRQVSGVRRKQPPAQRKIRGMKPQKAYNKRMWRTNVPKEELDEC